MTSEEKAVLKRGGVGYVPGPKAGGGGYSTGIAAFQAYESGT